MAAPTLALTPAEKLFREALLECRKTMTGVKGMEELELRWTGGWVRDKILGVTSHDIDVTLSTMTGWQFGQALQKYMKNNAEHYEKEAQKQGFKAEIKNLHKIEANPEKSKHLETITTRMFGIDIDFVNLRKEIYDEHSRNPKMEFGTPKEDALRRDACCNALFYNLDSQRVEDFTGRGLSDMQKKTIRTPLAPYQTFKDDPLRVLRLIRFAARLGYTIEDDALQAMSDSTIHEALRLKISRERIGVEIGKIMTGPDPFGGLVQIYERKLYTTVFADPENNDTIVSDAQFRDALDTLRAVLETTSAIHLVLKPKDEPVVAWTLATYVPFKDSEEAAVAAARAGIKATNNVSKILGDAVKYRERLSNLAKKVGQGDATRAEVGMLLKQCGTSWRSHVLYALLCDTVDDKLDDVMARYSAFAQYIEEQRLADAANIKPILNGNEIKKSLEVQKAGPWLKRAIDVVTEWQFANPKGTAKEATAMVKRRRNSLVTD